MRVDEDREPSELAALIERHTGRDGTHPTAIAPLTLFRSSVPSEPVHGAYRPALCLTARGGKQVMLAGETYVYDATHYLLATADLPVVGQVVRATPLAPYLSLALDIDPRQIGALLADAVLPTAPDGHTPSDVTPPRGLTVGCLDAPLRDAVTRLVRLLDRPQHVPVLAPLVIREILYLLLVGERGEGLCRIALAGGERQGVFRALHWLKDHFAEPMRVDALAHESHMSVSVFHEHFKAVTAMSPLQYQKRLRLQEARRLMLGGGLDAATAALQVGYESASQFSREYSRLFGESPRRDVARLRAAAGLDRGDA